MKQFDLKKYLDNPLQNVVTRSGMPVRIICTDAVGSHPIVGLVKRSNGLESACRFYEYGNVDKNRECDNDLFFVPEKRKGWVNLYRTEGGRLIFGNVYYGKEIALEEHEKTAKTSNTCKHIDTIQIEWEE